jgi:uncharacterized lipoprotein NlpE involved in copper resistance
MKKMIFCIISLVMVLMGCASSGTAVAETNSNTDGTGTATKLAADINAAKPGSTVTLSGRVELKTALTVPEGVTLDLTGEGAALELQDGAVLTVNGTVNATGHGDHGTGWVEGSLRMGDGVAVIAGKGTISLTSKGCLLNIGSDKARRQLTLDGVTLVGVDNNSEPLVGIGKGGEFVLKSGTITGNTRVGNEWISGGGVGVWEGGLFTMKGGTISGNNAKGGTGAEGGGVKVDRGTFVMSGGTISGNTATADNTSNGGGVSVGVNAVFTMSGGAISGNTSSGGRYGGGSGVCIIGEGSTFTMHGGAISGNTATGGPGGSSGGGVKVSRGNPDQNRTGGTFTMTGGTISGNTVTGVVAGGGGVTVEQQPSTFTMQGGTISGNTSSGGRYYGGGGVQIKDGSVFIMEGGTIYGKADSLPAGTDASLANNVTHSGAALTVYKSTAKWGTGGTYQCGASQIGGGDIVRFDSNNWSGTDDTLIAIPAK